MRQLLQLVTTTFFYQSLIFFKPFLTITSCYFTKTTFGLLWLLSSTVRYQPLTTSGSCEGGAPCHKELPQGEADQGNPQAREQPLSESHRECLGHHEEQAGQ